MTTRHSPQLGNGGRIGLLADTHCHSPNGPHLPAAALDAFRGVDLIVHLGDMGEADVLDRLAMIAPVVATRGMDDPPADARITAARVLKVGGLALGALFDLAAAGIAVPQADRLTFSGTAVTEVLRATFGRNVDVVVFGATHREMVGYHEGVLFVNPGSATLPAPARPNGLGTVAVLDVRERVAMVEVVHL